MKNESTLGAASVGILLAAGASRRFGATKQLARLQGRPLVRIVADTLRASHLDYILVVVGHDGDAVGHAAGCGVITIPNPSYQTGQSSSLRAGLKAAADLGPGVGVAVVVLADQPSLPTELVDRAILECRRVERPVRTRYLDATGPPVALPRRTWGRLLGLLHGDAGAASLLTKLGAVDLQINRPMPRDVDYPTDLLDLSGDDPA